MAAPELGPLFVVEDNLTPETQVHISQLEEVIEVHPDTFIEAVKMSAIGTEAVMQLLDFMDAHVEGREVLRTWMNVFVLNEDSKVSFDAATEAEIDDDTIFQRLLHSKTDPVARRDSIRRLRFTHYAKRMKQHKEDQASQDNVIPINEGKPSQHLTRPA